MWCHARCGVGELDRGRWIMAWEGTGQPVARVAPFIPLFLSVWLLLLFASFDVLVNCLCPSSQVLPFSSHSPPHPSGRRGDKTAMWSFAASQGQTTTHPVSLRRSTVRAFAGSLSVCWMLVSEGCQIFLSCWLVRAIFVKSSSATLKFHLSAVSLMFTTSPSSV